LGDARGDVPGPVLSMLQADNRAIQSTLRLGAMRMFVNPRLKGVSRLSRSSRATVALMSNRSTRSA
jgi:hypothetical protein